MVSRLRPPSPALAPLALLLCALPGCQELPRVYSTASVGGELRFHDDFNRDALGPNWNVTGPDARIEDGHVVVQGLKNHPLWLVPPIPDDVRIEFDAWADGEEGDVKVEIGGDGTSVATSANYVATGYVVIFGGWNNRLNAIARKDEHARDRVTENEPRVEPGRRYHFAITRTRGELTWELDGRELLRMEDPDPLVGPGHDHFAFGGWESRVHFDDLKIYALEAEPVEGPEGKAAP